MSDFKDLNVWDKHFDFGPCQDVTWMMSGDQRYIADSSGEPSSDDAVF